MKNFVLLAVAVALWVGVGKKASSIAVRRRLHPLILGLFLTVVAVLGLLGGVFHQTYRLDAEPLVPLVSTQIRMTLAEIDALTGLNGTQEIMVRGKIVDQCYLLGCWLKLRDKTGNLFVDLAPSGLSTKRFPVGSRVQVTGYIGKTRVGKVGFIASNIKALMSKEIP